MWWFMIGLGAILITMYPWPNEEAHVFQASCVRLVLLLIGSGLIGYGLGIGGR